MRYFSVLFFVLLILCAPLAAQEGAIRQWASSATASSEYSPTSWNANQATGAPNATGCADDVNAWASATITNPNEYLTVYFDIAVYPTQVNIHQNYNPGAITGIDLLPADGGANIPVRNSADKGTTCPGALTINIEWDDPVLISGVTIYLDQRAIGNWNEIDAVELVGIPAKGANVPTQTANDYVISGEVGRSVSCDDGTAFNNGIEVRVIQMRTGFTYTATAIGINDFDPVLAVLNEAGRGLCVDDDLNAAQYSAWLPTTGEVPASRKSAQVTFANNGRGAFADISLVVGGYGNATGEFILILEGMALTTADGQGDPFAIQITPGMIASEVPPTVYMISVTSRFDPLIAVIDSEYNFVRDNDKNYIACDDGGDPQACWGKSFSLQGSYVSRTQGRALPGGSLDAMLQLNPTAGGEWLFYNFLMRSSGMNSFGDYMVVFHMGISD